MPSTGSDTCSISIDILAEMRSPHPKKSESNGPFPNPIFQILKFQIPKNQRSRRRA
jgi:hypothetical protein